MKMYFNSNQISIKSEEYTSKCCGNCGFLSEKYKNRIKECSNFGKKNP